MSGGIYKIRNVVNGKVYIGSTVDLVKRKKQHFSNLKKNKHSNCHLQTSWNKYGEQNFIFEIIEECVEENLSLLEQQWIDFYNSHESNNGYNLIKYIDGHTSHSKETIDKIKLARSKQVFSKESIAKRSEKTKGENNHFYGKNHSPETKEKISQAKLGVPVHTEEHKNKMKNMFTGEGNPSAMLNWEKIKEIRFLYSQKIFSSRKLSKMFSVGKTTILRIVQNKNWFDPLYIPPSDIPRIVSTETRKKLSEANKGKPGPMKGRTHSEESRALIKEKRSKQITSDETREKMSKMFSGKGNPFYGQKHSKESIEKQKQTRKKNGKLIGEKNPSAKLDWEKVKEIREKHKNGNKIIPLSEEYGVSIYTIGRIINNENWVDTKLKQGASGKHFFVKLSQEQVNEIRKLHIESDITHKQLSINFNVSIRTISLILNNKRWHDLSYIPKTKHT